MYFSHHHGDVLELANGELPKFLNIKKLVGKALDNLFNGFKGTIEPNLFEITYRALNNAIREGWGTVAYNRKDQAFVDQLKKSGAWFAARKSYQQQQELAKLLTDEKGKLRTWKQFQTASKDIVANYNQNWLKVEYQTAIASARNAKLWKQYEADSDLYPNLKYLPSRAATPREEHKPWYGVIRPINDDFWVHHYPPSAWNCQCGFEQTDEKATELPADIEEPKLGLSNNPGKSGSLFNIDEHPYSSNLDKETRKKIDEEGERLAEN